VISRVVEIATATINWLQILAEGDDEKQAKLEEFTLENILSHIHYYRIHDYIEQIALFNTLDDFLQSHPLVRLVVIDSMSFHFRHDFTDYMMRTRVLNNASQSLLNLASKHRLAVFLTNQMTTKVKDEHTQLVPALGQIWGHAATNRVILYWRDGNRYAHLAKSPHSGNRTVPYCVTTDGIRSLPQTDQSQ